MAHSYAGNFVHCVFSTKERRSTIPAESQEKLWAYLLGIARNHKIELLAAGGTTNHVHLLLSLPPAMALAVAIQKLKANSSRWLSEHGSAFEWQKGYGAFSVSASQLSAVQNYIQTQPEHHKKHTFEDEFISLLQKYGVKYEAGQVFG